MGKMKTVGGAKLTRHEESCLRALVRLAERWNSKPNRVWLFSASAVLVPLLFPGGGNEEPEFDDAGRINKNNIVVDGKDRVRDQMMIDIPNDGGDW